ncbi:MAG: ATP-binding protein [Polyangia bacterium]
MTLRTKLLLAQLPLALSLLVVGVASRKTIDALDRNSQNILKDNHLSVLAAQRMRDAADALGRAALRTTAGKEDVARRRGDFEHELRFQEGNITESGEREMTQRLRQRWSRFQSQLDAALAQRRPETEQPLEESLVALESTLNEITDVNQDAMVRKSESARKSAERMSFALVAVTFAAFLIGILASGYLTNRLTRPLAVLAAAVRRLGEGDLAARAKLDGEDEISQLAREFNTMADHLAEYRSSSLGELLQAQQSAQAAIDSIPDPVLVLRAGGVLLNANKAAAELFGIDVEGAGDTVFDRAPAEVVQTVTRMREHTASGRGAYLPKSLEEAAPIEVRGGTRYFLTRANPMNDEEGRPTGLTILFQDVTRLRRFDELKNDLVATVAHEFRTPLTSLRMAIHLCVDGVVGPLTEKQADLLFAAREDCERLQGIVEDLLDLSRIQAGRIELHSRPILSTTLLRQGVDDNRALAAGKGVELSVGKLTVDRQVIADPDRIQLVVGNLVQNAIRHTPSGGSVELRAAPEGDALRFEVSDTGSGIAAEHLPRLFDRFYRVPGAPPGGAGLGLYICKEIVEAHGGRVGVVSDVGRGSIFWFTLPLAGTNAEEAA